MHGAEMKTIGVLGGMGPMATVDLARAIVENTLAGCDQQHPPMIVDSNTRIADRTAFLTGRSEEDPRPEIIKSIQRLEQAGAGCIVMPCNTAHAFYDEISAAAAKPVLHMPEETARWIAEHHPEEKEIGVLATQGTYAAGVYGDSLRKFGLAQVKPDDAGREEATRLIYDGIKANNYDYDFSGYEQAIKAFKRETGIKVIILGCTELSVAHAFHPIEGIYADPLQIVARAAITLVNGRVVRESEDGPA